MATKRGQKPGIAAPASNGKAPAASPANAWARPLKTTGPPPGMGPADKSRAPGNVTKPAATKTSSTSNNNSKDPNDAVLSTIHRERLLHLSLTLIGQKVVATLTDGTVLEGIFHTFTPFDGLDADVKNKYVFNAVKAVKTGKENNIKTGSTVILGVDKVTQIYAKNINLDRPNKNGGAYTGKGGNSDLITDTQISGGRNTGSRELVAAGSAWTSAPGTKQTRAEALAGALGTTGKGGDTSGLKGSIGGWDQFKANQELFNVNASFDENLYTTELDKSQIDSHKIAEAERIAREIESTSSTNIHIAEERGQALETDYDEEDRYSGVLTKDGKQRHEEQEKAKATSTSAPKKMNYAAAAAKADTGTAKKTGPPGFSSLPGKSANVEPKATEGTTEPETENKKADDSPPKESPVEETKADAAETSKNVTPDQEINPPVEAENDTGTKAADESETETQSEEKKETKEVAKTSKLNANAKEFTFNPAAKSFTPSFAGGGASFASHMQQPQHVVDPNMQNYGGVPIQHPHYMHAQMAQPGMMPMMSPQYPGMRYMPQYPTMDQHVPQISPHQPPHVPPAAGAPVGGQPPLTGTTAPSSQAISMSNDGEAPGPSSSDGDASQPAAPSQQGPQSQQALQQQPMTMPYNVAPPGAYFAGGAMAMHPRGPGGYPPQFVGAPQQMPVVQQGGPYRQMYPMQPGAMPPNMHMRGPGGAPYYAGPVGPIPYPPGAYGHGMMEDPDAFRGRGRGPGRGRGRGGRRAGGRVPGRGNYQHQQPANYPGSGQNSGRSTPQQHGGPEQGANFSHDGDMTHDVGSQEAST